MAATLTPDPTAAGTFTIGGDLEIHRMGFGAMRLTGDGVWGPPEDRGHAHRVLGRAVDLGIDFIPWFPLKTGDLAEDAALRRIAEGYGATPAQVTLAWLLRRSPVMLPIPGTSSLEHLEENVAAATLQLTDDDAEALVAAARESSTDAD